jgi:hypothetical protein
LGYTDTNFFVAAGSRFVILASIEPITTKNSFMGNISIEVWDATGNKRQLVEVPSDAEINRLVAVLIDRMNLPRHSPDGQLMSYKFHHKKSGRQLLETDTLETARVEAGDILRLQPEITAGRGGVHLPTRSESENHSRD